MDITIMEAPTQETNTSEQNQRAQKKKRDAEGAHRKGAASGPSQTQGAEIQVEGQQALEDIRESCEEETDH